MSNASGLTTEILYERLLTFAKRCQKLMRSLPKTISNIEYGKQLIRSSASPGANYIEAVEAGSYKDFIYRLKICRKESKESNHWLNLIQFSNENVAFVEYETKELIQEAREFIRIFSSSITTSEVNKQFKK